MEQAYKYSATWNKLPEMKLNTHILSDLERRKLEVFVKTGRRMRTVHQLFWRVNRYLPEIKQDLELIETALRKYEKEKQHSGPRSKS